LVVFFILEKLEIMLSLQKTGFIPLCLGLIFHSCSPANLYQRTAFDVNKINTGYNAGKQVVYHNDIPVRAMRQLLKLFPKADGIKWHTSASAGWTAAFKIGTVETNMNFDADGDWSRVYNSYAEVPPVVKNIVAKNYNDYHITSVRGIMIAADDLNITYSIVINKEDNCKVLKLYSGCLTVFSELGNNAAVLK
jgi:hypothetical protein